VTTLVRQRLIPELDLMDRRLRHMIEGFPVMPVFASPGLPAADVYETSEEYVVELEVPGYDEKELGIEISDHTLTIGGTHFETEETTGKSYRLRERLDRTFERRFLLPVEVDTEQLAADFTKGVLKVHAPKLAVAEPRTVEISGE
jgi:HSP20 family protein